MSTIHEYISKNASLATIQRAKEILIRKMIISMKFFPQQKMIRAKVLGNWPYDVRINLSQKNGISSSCNCPYNYPGLCKHEVAVLLKYDEEGEKNMDIVYEEKPNDEKEIEPAPNMNIINYQELNPEQIEDLVGTKTYQQSRFYQGKVSIFAYNNSSEIKFSVRDIIHNYYSDHEYVSFQLEKDELSIDCSCKAHKYCEHIAAVLFYLINEEKKPDFFRLLEKDFRIARKKEFAAIYGLSDIKSIDNAVALQCRDGRLVYELSPKYADLLPVGEESRKKKKEMLSLAYRELHSPINFLPITMQNEAEPDRGFGLIFTLMGEQSQWLTLQCCTARLNKKGDKLVSHFQYEKLEDFPDISEREKQILELATRYNRLSTLKLNKYAFTHECHNHLTILFNLLNEDSHVFIHETGYHYSLDTKPKKSELQPLHVNGAPFDMEFDVYSDQNFVYLHLVLKIEEKRIRISSESIEKHFPSVYFARDADYIYPARNMAAISALIGYLKNPVQKMVKNHTEEFLAEFVIPLMENHHVNLEKIEGYSLEHSSPKPMKKKLYVSGIGQFVMFRPTICYEENKEINILKTGSCVTLEDKVITLLERDTEFESKYYYLLKSLHHKFAKQFPDEFFYLDINELMHDQWFFSAFERLDKDGVEVLGFNELKNFKFSTQRARITSQISSGQDWFDVNVVVSFGKEKVSLADVRKSVLRNDKYIRLSDGSLGILPEEWLPKFSRIFRQGELKNEKITISSRKFMIIDELLEDIDDLGLIKELNAKKRKLEEFTELKSTKVPRQIKAELRSYQKEGLNWLNFLDEFGWGGILADDMGLGKTLQILTFLAQKKTKNASLIVVPTTLMFNWENEIAKFCPSLKVHFHYGQNRNKDHEGFDDVHLVITTYGLVINDIEWLKAYPFHYVILDESQAIKNPQSLRFKAVGLLQAKTRITMTGTPIENNTFDLYAQMHFANPGLLGNAKAFKDNFSTPIDKDGDKERAEELRKMIKPFMIRRTKEQVATELPPKTEEILYCHMEKAQQSVYDAFKHKYRDLLLGKIDEDGLEKSKIYVLEGLMKLRQICDSPKLLPGDEEYGSESVKIVELLRNIEEKTGNHKIVVFSQFVGMLALIKAELDKDKVNYEYLDGKSSPKQRRDSVDRFQSTENCRVFLISLKAGGTGLNLTAADYVFIVDPWWNPAVESQAIDRCYRIGQDKKVFAYRMICKGTIEEKIVSYQHKKKAVADDIIQAEESFVKNLSLDDITALFS